MPKVFRPKNARTKKHRGFRIKTSQRKQRTRKQRTRSQLKKNNSRLLSRKRIMRGGGGMSDEVLNFFKNDYKNEDTLNKKIEEYKKIIMNKIDKIAKLQFHTKKKEGAIRVLKLRDYFNNCTLVVPVVPTDSDIDVITNITEMFDENKGSSFHRGQHDEEERFQNNEIYEENPSKWIESEIDVFFERIKFDLLEISRNNNGFFKNPFSANTPTHYIILDMCSNYGE